MSVQHCSVDTPVRPDYTRPSGLAAFVLTLCMIVMPPTQAAENRGANPPVTSGSRPQPAEEELPANERGAPAIDEQQNIADPERVFALRMLEFAEQELRLAEAHAATATDAQMREIANDTAASRRKEIRRLREWLAKRKVLRTPRMLKP